MIQDLEIKLSNLGYPIWVSDLLATYYRAPDHPFKLRLAGWVERKLGNRKILVKTKPGFRFAVDRVDYIQKTVFRTREWEPEIGAILNQELTQDDVFLI